MEQNVQSMQIKELKEELFQSYFNDSRHVIELCGKLEHLAHQTEDRELLGFAFFYKGEAHYILNEVEEMFKTMALAVPCLSETSQWEFLARTYNIMAITSINRGQAPVAVDYYLTALKCTQEHDLSAITCSIHINLGYLYMQNGIYGEGQYHFDEAYKLYCGVADKESQIGRLTMIYTNLVTCYMLQGDMADAELYMERLNRECRPYFNHMDDVYVGCMAARYYHIKGELDKRDATIANILNGLEKQIPILDLFDDLYSLCELALNIKNYEVFLLVIGKLEPIVSNTGLINLDKKILELKLHYYEASGEKEKYLQATARFFTLSQRMEEQSREMIANMIHVRTALENARERNAILMEKSETDPLTRLANRYRMNDAFQQMLDECMRENKILSVEILDIDYFKEYNDNYGHQAGDECIRRVASLIKAMERENVFCARYGGDEFIIIYEGLQEQEVVERAMRLRKKIMELGIAHAYSKALPIVTISQGICQSIPQEGNKSWDFLHIADEYLYKAKKQERNSICAGTLRGQYQTISLQ